MFGQIKMIAAVSGKRDDIVALVRSGSDTMPWYRAQVVGKDLRSPEGWAHCQGHVRSGGCTWP